MSERLIRNTTPDGKCKYALVRLDKIRLLPGNSWAWAEIDSALKELEAHGVLEYGEPGTEEECFVIKLKDRNAATPLSVYASIAAANGEPRRYVEDIIELAERASRHPSKKRPD